MFKKCEVINSDSKKKQLSIFDFLSSSKKQSSTLEKKNSFGFVSTFKRKHSFGSANDCKVLKIKNTTTSDTLMDASNEDTTAHSCPSRLLEALESPQTNFSESTFSGDEEVSATSKSLVSTDETSAKKSDTDLKMEDKHIDPKNGSNENLEYDSPSMFDSKSEDAKAESGSNQSSSPSFPYIPPCRGLPFNELKRTPQCSSPLPELTASAAHTVLFDEAYIGSAPPPPRRSNYVDAWDSEHVRLPCSPQNLYPTKTNSVFQRKKLLSRWELIESSLLNRISSSIDLEEAIFTYNSRYATQWSFSALHKFFTDDVDDGYRSKFFTSTLPAMVRLALRLPQLCTEDRQADHPRSEIKLQLNCTIERCHVSVKPITLLSRQKNHTLTLTQEQIACLLCNAFFCTFPWRNSKKSTSEYANYPDINFSRLLMGHSPKDTVVPEKLRMLFHYFERVTTSMPCGTVSFERRALKHFPKWDRSPCTLSGFHVRTDGMIETEGAGMLQVDFANRFLGGGVLGLGAVQEEIRFCICPELIASRLFVEAMENNECVVITGAEQYSTYVGYGSTFRWTGNYDDQTNRDEWRRRRTQIVAMDAICFHQSSNQYLPSNVSRELCKAYCAFYDVDPDHAPAIATGKWGCGAFRGDPMLKGLIQLLAAAALCREVCFFTFNDDQLVESMNKMYSFIEEKKLSISDIWSILVRYNKEIVTTGATEELLDFIMRVNNEYNDLTDESDG